MPTRLSLRVLLLASAAMLAGCTTNPIAHAAANPPTRPTTGPQFLTIGGGPDVYNNQASLESNALYFQRVLHQQGLDDQPHAILFADGNNPQPDLEVEDPAADSAVPRINRLFARILGPMPRLTTTYRNHQIPHLTGPATLQGVDQYFNNALFKLSDASRLVIYFTGHGNRSRDKKPQSQIPLWGGSNLTVRHLSDRLELLPPQLPVTLVMVQCFSGGFANVIYHNADPAKGLADRDVCGFFATVPDRIAAGCTPDINEADDHEYSTDFFAALSGQTRGGHPITGSADFNHDGLIGLDEAHAYAVIHDPTLDIPTKTSDEFLRHFSRETGTPAGLLTADALYADLRAAAGPADRAVLDTLSNQLHLTGDARVKQAVHESAELESLRHQLHQRRRDLQSEYQSLRNQLAGALRSRWPELANPWHPRVAQIMANEADAVTTLLARQPGFGRFLSLETELDGGEQRDLDLEKRWARYQRFIRTAHTIALAANLPKVATPETCRRYQRLITLESRPLRS